MIDPVEDREEQPEDKTSPFLADTRLSQLTGFNRNIHKHYLFLL